MTAIALPRAPGTAVRERSERDGSSWRVATRLARREVRRRWGRTLLVMILVAVPVLGMTVVTTLVRTTKSSAAHDFEREFGQANLAATDGVDARRRMAGRHAPCMAARSVRWGSSPAARAPRQGDRSRSRQPGAARRALLRADGSPYRG
jgi:putative ABC transport system permease protein